MLSTTLDSSMGTPKDQQSDLGIGWVLSIWVYVLKRKTGNLALPFRAIAQPPMMTSTMVYTKVVVINLEMPLEAEVT